MDKDALIASQQQEILELRATVARLEAAVAELTARLNQNSRNSGRPPSSDGLAKPAPKSLREKSGRRPGGQPGHRGRTLEMSRTPDSVHVHALEKCPCCGQAALERTGSEARQVVGLPPVRPQVAEHRALRYACSGCGARCAAPFPAEAAAPGAQYGPGVKAMAAYLLVQQHVSYERTQEFFADAFGLEISQGTLRGFVSGLAGSLSGYEQAVTALLKSAPVAHFDETGVRVAGKTWWGHVACTEKLTRFALDAKRGRDAHERMGILPEYQGVAVHDRLAAYYTHACANALCGAHILRELTFADEQLKAAWAAPAKEILLAAKSLADCGKCGPWHYARARNKLQRLLRGALRGYPPPQRPPGKRGRAKQSKDKNLLDALLANLDDVLRFLRDPLVPFTNNQAERDLRPLKVKQKVSGCFRSEQGGRDCFRIRGYISTVRKNGGGILLNLQNAFEGTPFLPVGA